MQCGRTNISYGHFDIQWTNNSLIKLIYGKYVVHQIVRLYWGYHVFAAQ